MVNYKNGCVYKLCSKDPNTTEIYVGSTVCFKQRKSAHKSSCNNEEGGRYKMRLYEFIRENGGFVNWDMIELEKYSATDKKDLEKRERYWLESLKASLNSKVPTRSPKEYREENKEIISEKRKIYYEENKEIISEKHKLYNSENKENTSEKSKIYREENKEKIAIYCANHREAINLKQSKYLDRNREEINKKASRQIECDCGVNHRIDMKKKHSNSIKHKRWETLYDFVYS